MKKWKSIAEWNGFTTEDGHDTKEQAEAVCRMLEKDGFGGEGKFFPKSTKVEPLNNIKDCQYFEFESKGCFYSQLRAPCNYGDNFERPANCPDPTKDKCTDCAVESLCVKECGE